MSYRVPLNDQCRTSSREGIQVLRAVGAFLVVSLHAGVPLVTHPMPGLVWPVRHPEPSQLLNIGFWMIAACVMPVFLAMSGYLAAQSLQKRGPIDFIQQRFLRIGRPLVLSMVVLLPIELYLWLIGWALCGEIDWIKLRSFKLDDRHDGLWGTSHLWYLQYVLIDSLILGAILGYGPVSFDQRVRLFVSTISLKRRKQIQTVLQSTLMIWVGLASGLVLWNSPQVILGFQHSFVPVPSKFVFSSLFFFLGVAWFYLDQLQVMESSVGMAIGGLSKCLAAVVLFSLTWSKWCEQILGGLTSDDQFGLAMTVATFAMLMTSGLWQLAGSLRGPVPRFLQQVSEASFGIYLFHHPFNAAVQIGLHFTGLPALMQFAITVTTVLSVSLFTFERGVKGRWLGDFLEGKTVTENQKFQSDRSDVPVAPAVESNGTEVTESTQKRAA